MSKIHDDIDSLNNEMDKLYYMPAGYKDMSRIKLLESERDRLISNLCDNCGLYWKEPCGLCKHCIRINKRK